MKFIIFHESLIHSLHCRTNTYPKSQAPERYRLRSSDGVAENENIIVKDSSKYRVGSSHAPVFTKVSKNSNHLSGGNHTNTNESSSSNIDNKTNSNGKEQNKEEEEVIYF